MTFMSRRCCITASLVLLLVGLAACDSVEERISPTGRYEANTLTTAVQVETAAGTDSVFFIDLREAGATLEMTLSRNDTGRVLQGRLMLPDDIFADSFYVPALPGRGFGRNTRSPAQADGIDTTFTGSWVQVQNEIFLGIDADTSAPEFRWPVPTSYVVQDDGNTLKARTNTTLMTPTDTVNAYQVVLRRP